MGCRIAVIMSIYRGDTLKYLSPCMDSILNQKYSDFDFYIQIDGQVDSDIDKYLTGLTDSRVRIFRREENKGLAQSLNDLLAIVLPSGYEYIARMDADDISELNRFERQIAYMQEHLDIECLGTWAREIDGGGVDYFNKKMPESHSGCLSLFRKRDCVIHPTVMFRRSFFEKAGLYPLNTYFSEDTMMWAQGFSTGCKFGNVPEYLYRFRMDVRFFERRRGWKHAKSIFLLRHKVNKMLHFGLVADFYALAYAGMKLLPTSMVDWLYRTVR